MVVDLVRSYDSYPIASISVQAQPMIACVYAYCSSLLQTMKARLRSLLGLQPVEPPPCWWHSSAVADGRHYVWRGAGPEQGSNIIAVCDSSTEQWSFFPTTGPLPPGEWGGRSVCVGRCLYTFGGQYRSSYFNDMSKLDLDTFQWTKIQYFGSQPMKKVGCGLVRVNENTLCCFGGEGIKGPTQPRSTFTSGWTNEFHFFDTQNGNFSICTFAVCFLLVGGVPPSLTYMQETMFTFINILILSVELVNVDTCIMCVITVCHYNE